MSRQYDTWIAEYVAKHSGFVRGKCASATAEMVEAFPELKRVAGFVEVLWPAAGVVTEQHWWCLDPSGDVVDPTAAQFHVVLSREALDLNNPDDVGRIPTGRCMCCGEDVFRGDTFCTKQCERDFCSDMGLREVSPGVYQ